MPKDVGWHAKKYTNKIMVLYIGDKRFSGWLPASCIYKLVQCLAEAKEHVFFWTTGQD